MSPRAGERLESGLLVKSTQLSQIEVNPEGTELPDSRLKPAPVQGRYSKIRLAVFFGRFDSKGTPDVFFFFFFFQA